MDLADLRASARSKSDEEADGFVNNAALDRFINEGNRFLYNRIVAENEEYFEIEGTSGNGGLISVVSGTHKYSLPTDCQKLCVVEWRTSSSTSENDWQPMTRVERRNRNRFSISSTAPSLYQPWGKFGYYSNKDSIYVVPAPSAAMSMRVWYIPRTESLVDADDEPDSPEEFHELIADFAAMRILGKSGEDIFKELADTFKLQLDTFLSTIGHRDFEAPTMVISDSGG